MGITAAFTAHPASMDETYGEHFRFAMTCSGKLAKAAAAAAIHAVCPSLCETTASRAIIELNECVTSGARGAAREAQAA